MSRRLRALLVLGTMSAIAVVMWMTVGRRPAEPPVRHVILFTLDTTRADRIGAYGASAARTPTLDALAAYLEADIRLPTLSLLAPDSSTIAAGRQLFLQQGCPVCHGGLHWTASQMPGPAGTLDPDANGMVDGVLRQVGTMNPQDIRGATGFDPPALLGAALTAPYLHDGSRASLEALIHSGHPQAATPTTLTTEEVTQLALFLQSIDNETEPFVAPTPP